MQTRLGTTRIGFKFFFIPAEGDPSTRLNAGLWALGADCSIKHEGNGGADHER